VARQIVISVVARRQPGFIRQLAEVLFFQSATDGIARWSVRATDHGDHEWFAFDAWSPQEASEKKARLETELAELGPEAFLRKYSERYRSER
jgi:hypothetical protein